MELGVVIFRNVAGDVTRESLNEWKRMATALGVMTDEKGKGKTVILHLRHEDDDLVFYVYEQGNLCQLQIEYMRVKTRSGKMVKAIEGLIEICKLTGEKYQAGRTEMFRTLYVNGLIMDDGPFANRKPEPDLDLRIKREAVMGHIYLKLDQYMHAKEVGDLLEEERLFDILRSYTDELNQIDETLFHTK
ncbi:MAG: hypothetical protein JWN30_2575 [Bacilli bacterium]|nr:hypothetical protein [Bacilli bacterium]